MSQAPNIDLFPISKDSHTISYITSSPATDNGLSTSEWNELDQAAKEGFTVNDQLDMKRMGKKQEFRRNFQFLTSVGSTLR